jgi:hypothetical protein
MKKSLLSVALLCAVFNSFGQQPATFNGLNMSLGNLATVSDAKTRSISPENFTGEKGKGGMADPVKDKGRRNIANASLAAAELGRGWKVNPYIVIDPGQTVTIAEMEGPGAIQHIWMTPTGNWRHSILRVYWDDEKEPSIESPVGAFFGMGWNRYSPLNSLPVIVNPGSAFNCYWTMPFRKKCKITMENIYVNPMSLYYQVDYTLTRVEPNQAYFHAQYRMARPDSTSVYTILDKVKGKGQYVGVYMGLEAKNNGWWGEGEVKFYIDGDSDFATIVGTGTEDYFCGSYDFDTHKKIPTNNEETNYTEYSTAYNGLHQVIGGDSHYQVMQRFGMYRWHIQDPIRFDQDLKITIQDLGWKSGGRYLAQKSDIISVAFWYQLEPHTAFRKLPSKDELEIN